MNSQKQDMGTGSVPKLLLQLMIPAVVAQVVNLLYNIVDRIYIGHIPGIGAAGLSENNFRGIRQISANPFPEDISRTMV